MNRRIKLKEFIREHKIASIIVLVSVIAMGSLGTFFIIDYVNALSPTRITLATTTSTWDSGLLQELLPKFTEKTGIYVSVLHVGTGEAIQLAKDGNADIILVHARSKENDFVNASLGVDGVPYGIQRACVMFNDFIIIGDTNNPAKLQVGDNITTVMNKLAAGMNAYNTTFYSRADDSGTNTKELALWALIGVDPEINWSKSPTQYAETGQGMGDTVAIVNEDPQGYTLCDRGTWLAVKNINTNLAILAESVPGENVLLNPYGIIPVNPVIYPHVNYAAACRLVGFFTSNYGQSLIGSFTVGGQVLFHPDFGTCNYNTTCPTTATEVIVWNDFHAEFDN